MITMDLVQLVKSETQKSSSETQSKAEDGHQAEAALSGSLDPRLAM